MKPQTDIVYYLGILKGLYLKISATEERGAQLLAVIDSATQNLIDLANHGTELRLFDVEITNDGKEIKL